MKKSILTFTAFVLIGLSSFAQSLSIDASKAEVSFNVVADKVSGSVKGIDAKIVFDANDLSEASIEGTVDVTTLTTGNGMRDKHLQSAEYFDAAKYPTMSFKSKSIEKTDAGYTMKGTMTIKGTAHEVEIKFTYADNKFDGKAVVYTNDFELAKKKDRNESKVLVKITIPVK